MGLDLSSDSSSVVKAVGITNQWETTVCWNDRTGRVYHNAIVSDDARNAVVADAIIGKNSSEGDGKDCLGSRTGLRRHEGPMADRQRSRTPKGSHGFVGSPARVDRAKSHVQAIRRIREIPLEFGNVVYQPSDLRAGEHPSST